MLMIIGTGTTWAISCRMGNPEFEIKATVNTRQILIILIWMYRFEKHISIRLRGMVAVEWSQLRN